MDRLGEHGPGAAQAICILRRVRPLRRKRMLVRYEAHFVRNGRIKVVTRLFYGRPCALRMGTAFFVVPGGDCLNSIIEIKNLSKTFGSGES